MGPFDRFDSNAKKVLALAQDEAIRFKHNYIGTEHLILGLVREGGVAAQVLSAMGAELSKLRTAVGSIIGPGDATISPSEITLSPRTKKVIEFAVDEARKLGRSDVSTAHLLLGLVREGEGIAAGVLESLGIRLPAVRAKVIEMLQHPAPAGHSAPVVSPASVVDPASIVAFRFGSGEARTSMDRVAEETQRVIALAQNEAIGLGQTWVGTEHLVLGLVTANGTLAQKVLQSLGITIDAVRERAAKMPAPGAEWKAHELRMTLLAERLLQRAPPHWPPMTPQGLLFAIVSEGESQGAQILDALGATAQKVRDELGKLDPPH